MSSYNLNTPFLINVLHSLPQVQALKPYTPGGSVRQKWQAVAEVLSRTWPFQSHGALAGPDCRDRYDEISAAFRATTSLELSSKSANVEAGLLTTFAFWALQAEYTQHSLAVAADIMG